MRKNIMNFSAAKLSHRCDLLLVDKEEIKSSMTGRKLYLGQLKVCSKTTSDYLKGPYHLEKKFHI